MKTKKLRDLILINTGKLDVNAKVDGGRYPFFTCSVMPYQINEYAFDCEAVLIAGNGDLNVKYYKGKFNAYQRTYILRKKESADISIKYLYYFMRHYITYLRKKTLGGIIKYIKLGQLTEAKIPLPPTLEEQEQIAYILSTVEELISKRKQSIQQLDELIKSIFIKMFDPIHNYCDWERTTIGDLVKEVKYGTSAPALGNTYKYLRMNNITYEGYWNFSDLKYIDVNETDYAKYSLEKNDLVFNRTNSKELVGKTAVYDSTEPVIIAGYLIRIRTNSKNNPWYIWGYLNSKYGKTRLANLCRNIVGMANINTKELQSIPILRPPLDLQNKFEIIVKRINNIRDNYQISLNQLENLYNALSQKAFKGELDLTKVPLIVDLDLDNAQEVVPKSLHHALQLTNKLFRNELSHLISLQNRLPKLGNSYIKNAQLVRNFTEMPKEIQDTAQALNRVFNINKHTIDIPDYQSYQKSFANDDEEFEQSIAIYQPKEQDIMALLADNTILSFDQIVSRLNLENKLNLTSYESLKNTLYQLLKDNKIKQTEEKITFAKGDKEKTYPVLKFQKVST